jgi:8-oxo-dGDP phosphatase
MHLRRPEPPYLDIVAISADGTRCGYSTTRLVDSDEEPVDAAARELEEETGYRAGHVEHVATFQPMPGMVDAEHFAFVGTNPERVSEPTELSEAARVEWIPLESVPAMIDAGEIWNAGSLVALSRVLLKRR